MFSHILMGNLVQQGFPYIDGKTGSPGFPTSHLVQATSDSLSTLSVVSPFVVSSPSTSTPFTVFTKLQFSELQHKECDLLIYKPAYTYSYMYAYAYMYTLEVGEPGQCVVHPPANVQHLLVNSDAACLPGLGVNLDRQVHKRRKIKSS